MHKKPCLVKASFPGFLEPLPDYPFRWRLLVDKFRSQPQRLREQRIRVGVPAAHPLAIENSVQIFFKGAIAAKNIAQKQLVRNLYLYSVMLLPYESGKNFCVQVPDCFHIWRLRINENISGGKNDRLVSRLS